MISFHSQQPIGYCYYEHLLLTQISLLSFAMIIITIKFLLNLLYHDPTTTKGLLLQIYQIKYENHSYSFFFSFSCLTW